MNQRFLKLVEQYLVIDQIVLGTVACATCCSAPDLPSFWAGSSGLPAMFVSLAAAPALAYVLLMVIVTVRYGREVRPMMKCVVLFLALID